MGDSPIVAYKNVENFIFNDRRSTDVDIFVSDDPDVLRVHSNILKLECPKMYALAIDQKHGSCRIEIPNTSLAALKQFFTFIYTGACELKQYNELLMLSMKFSMFVLQKYLSDAIDDLRVENVLEILPICIENQYENLKIKVMDFLGAHFSAIIRSPSFIQIEREVLGIILAIDCVDAAFIREADLFEVIIANVDAKRKQQTRREYLGDLIKLVRFPTMTTIEFAKIVTKYDDVLLPTECCSIFVEISIKTPNGLGFSSDERQHEIRRISSVPSEASIKTGKVLAISHKGYKLVKSRKFPSECSTFHVNFPTILTGVVLFNPYQRNAVIKLKLTDQQGNVLYKTTVELECSEKDSGHTRRLDFSKNVELENNKTYMLEVDYGNVSTYLTKSIEYWNYDAPAPIYPFSVYKANTEFMFQSLSAMINGFVIDTD